MGKLSALQIYNVISCIVRISEVMKLWKLILNFIPPLAQLDFFASLDVIRVNIAIMKTFFGVKKN